MSNHKILLFSRDPGGANTVIPLYEPLIKRGYTVRLYGKDVALDKYASSGLDGIDIEQVIGSVTPDGIENWIAAEEPNFIITGTSSSDFTEKYIWSAAEKLNIPSFAIVDQWINYGVRFSNNSPVENPDCAKEGSPTYLPTCILVMDERAKEEAIDEGLPSSRLIVTGQPYFESIVNEKNAISIETIDRRRAALNLTSDDFVIAYASEPVSEDYCGINYWGFTELSIFSEMIECIDVVSDRCQRRISIIVRPHPREDEKKYKEFAAGYTGKANIIIDRTSSTIELITLSDVIAGMSSMMLIEAIILEKPVMSVLIGIKENRSSPFVFDRSSLILSIRDRSSLLAQLAGLMSTSGMQTYGFDYIRTPISNVISCMERKLCLN